MWEWMVGVCGWERRKQIALQDTFMCFPSCIITHPKARGILHKHHFKYLPSCFLGFFFFCRDGGVAQRGDVSIKHKCPCSPNEETGQRGFMI